MTIASCVQRFGLCELLHALQHKEVQPDNDISTEFFETCSN